MILNMTEVLRIPVMEFWVLFLLGLSVTDTVTSCLPAAFDTLVRSVFKRITVK